MRAVEYKKSWDAALIFSEIRGYAEVNRYRLNQLRCSGSLGALRGESREK